MKRLVNLSVLKAPTLFKVLEGQLNRIYEWANRYHVPVWSLMVLCLLTVFIFYPFSISLESTIILKQGVFIVGGIIAFGIVGLALLYGRIRSFDKVLFVSLLLVLLTSAISTVFTTRPENAITGLFFELDTLAVIAAFVLLVLAAAVSFKNWPGDLGLLLAKVLGLGLILPAAILRLISSDQLWQNLYVDDVSLQVLSMMLSLVAAYQLDFNRSLSRGNKAYLLLLILLSLGLCYTAPHFVLFLIGLSLGLYLFFQSYRQAKIWPIFTIVISGAFGALLLLSFTPANQAQSTLYIREVTFLKEALAYNFQWGEANLFWGMGPHTFNAFWDVYRPYASYYDELWPADYEPPYVYNQPTYAFGLIPTLVINTGFLGLIAWVFMIYAAVRMSLKKLKAAAFHYDRTVPLALISLYGLLAIMLETPHVYILAITALSLGAMAASKLETGELLEQKVISRVFKFLSLIIILMALGLALAFTHKIVSTSLVFQKTVDLWLSKPDNIGLPIFSVEETIKARPQPEYYRVLAEIQFYSARNYLLKSKTLSEEDVKNVRKLLAESVINASKAAEMNKSDFRSWLVLGDINSFIYIFGAEDAAELAGAHYNEVITLLNIQPLAYYGLARLAYLKEEYEIALANIEESLKFRPNWGEAEKLKSEITAALQTTGG